MRGGVPARRSTSCVRGLRPGLVVQVVVSLEPTGVPAAMKRKAIGEHEQFERQAIICKAFGNPTRLHLMNMLLRGGCWAAELQNGLGISKANLSQHLAVLKSAGVVSTRREGKQLHCGIAMPEVKHAMGALRSILKAQGKQRRRWS